MKERLIIILLLLSTVIYAQNGLHIDIFTFDKICSYDNPADESELKGTIKLIRTSDQDASVHLFVENVGIDRRIELDKREVLKDGGVVHWNTEGSFAIVIYIDQIYIRLGKERFILKVSGHQIKEVIKKIDRL